MSVTGSPLGSALFLIVAYVVFDRFTFGVLPDPFRFIARRRREWALAHEMRLNAHDRRARLELAQLWLQRKAYKPAVELLKPNLEHGDDDLETLFTMGSACVGAGYTAQGEQLLGHVIERDADFRIGEVYLVLGRGQLARSEFQTARDSLKTFVGYRTGTVEGRVLLAQALKGSGDDASAALMRDEAWREFTGSPRFQKRQERFWAWRAQPLRPILYAVIAVVLAMVVIRTVSPAISGWARRHRAQQGGVYTDPSLQDPGD